MFGSCGPEMYGPDYILQKNVILVTLNYRVGVLGVCVILYHTECLLKYLIVVKRLRKF